MAFKKRNLLIPLIPLALISSVGVLAMTANFRFVNPKAPDATFMLPDNDRGPILVTERVAGQPQAVAHSRRHDFGKMNPLTMGTHSFVIRNRGDAPLRLSDGGTTCKCTTAEIEKLVLEPGKETKVAVEFNTGRDPSYLQTAKIKTNDPDNRLLEFTITGSVQVQVAAEPRSVNFGSVDPAGEPSVAQMLIHSSSRRQLTILDGQTNLPGMTWRTRPATEQDLAKLDAKSGLWVEVTVSAKELPRGEFIGLLTLETEGVESDETLTKETVRVGVAGRVLRRFSVYGGTVDERGTITLGEVWRGEGRTARLLVKVRDAQTDLGQVDIHVMPEFVESSWTKKKQPGLYVLQLKVPEAAPLGDYSGRFAGKVTVDVDHPRIGTQQFRLDFDVLKKQ